MADSLLVIFYVRDMDNELKNGYSARLLTVGDWQALKAMRLYSLQETPGVYGSNYAREAAFPDEEWQRRLQDEDCGYFGLYASARLIGITGIFAYNGSREEAILVSSFILPLHRGRGLSSILYRVRLDWARGRGFKRVVVSHRADNLASKAANQQFGFEFTHKENRLWPDGEEAENIFYKLEL